MQLSTPHLRELAELATRAAAEAGSMIAASRPQRVERKTEGWSLASQVVTEIDRHSEAIILDALMPTLERFELGLLSEERQDDRSRLTADYFWCIDPLDGTLPFIEGVPGYAVSIALVGRDGIPWIGVVHDPVDGVSLHAIRGLGAFRNGAPWPTGQTRGGDVLSVFADRSFVASEDHDVVVEALEQVAHDAGLAGVHVQATAGAVMNACGVLLNSPACYLKYPKPTGGGSLWDFAATACLFNEVGAVAADIRGNPLDLNRTDSLLMNHRGVLFATDETLALAIRTMQ